MSSISTRFITPPDEEALVYPYRRVWPSLIAELIATLVVVIAAFAVFNVLDVRLPRALVQPVNVAVAFVPLGAWGIFSLWRERRVVAPRHRLFAVLVVSALAANAVALPLIEGVFQPERWLPLESAISRIIGYTFTIGVTQEIVKYLAVRYIAWDGHFRDRTDAIAYGIASAVGYATVVALRTALAEPVTTDVMAFTMFNAYAINVAGSLIVAYGLGELRFSQPTPFLMTLMFALAALINGAAIPLRLGLSNASFTLAGGFARPILGVALSLAALVGVVVIVSFLFSTTERREREAAVRES